MSNVSVWPIDRTLSGVTTSDLSGPGGKVSEGVLCIPKSFRITGALLLDSKVSYPGHLFGRGSYSPSEMQSVYSTALADQVDKRLNLDRFSSHIYLSIYIYIYIYRTYTHIHKDTQINTYIYKNMLAHNVMYLTKRKHIYIYIYIYIYRCSGNVFHKKCFSFNNIWPLCLVK